jgi:hypothetical protein
MAVDTAKSAPYAPVNNVLGVVARFRERGLPETLTPHELTRIGIPEGNTSRTLQALRFLGLIDEEGHHTPAFSRLRIASTAEYPSTLAELLREAYSDIFRILDPAEANEIDLNDAFRGYHPQAQRSRMVVLFLGLCREAGLLRGSPPERVARAPRTVTTGKNNGKTAPPRGEHSGPKDEGKRTDRPNLTLQTLTREQMLLDKFPTFDPAWSPEVQAKWFDAFDRLMQTMRASDATGEGFDA